MKRVCCFVIMVLLAVELADAAPMAAQEPGLVKGMKRKRFLVRNGDVWTSGSRKQAATGGATKAEIQTGGMKEEGGLVGKKCITLEYCNKKMMTCAKECGVSQGQISKKHFPGGKCFLKCKKCIPIC